MSAVVQPGIGTLAPEGQMFLLRKLWVSELRGPFFTLGRLSFRG